MYRRDHIRQAPFKDARAGVHKWKQEYTQQPFSLIVNQNQNNSWGHKIKSMLFCSSKVQGISAVLVKNQLGIGKYILIYATALTENIIRDAPTPLKKKTIQARVL